MDWSKAKSELNGLVAELRSVHADLPSIYSSSLKGWSVEPASYACMHLKSAIAALKELRMEAKRC